MTREEAKTVGEVLTNADGGCPVCVEGLFRAFDRKFPGFRDVLEDVWHAEFSWKTMDWGDPA